MIKEAKLEPAWVKTCAPLIQQSRKSFVSIFLSLETYTSDPLPLSPGWTGYSPAQVSCTFLRHSLRLRPWFQDPRSISLKFSPFPISFSKGCIEGRFGGSYLSENIVIPSLPFEKDLIESRILVRWLWPDQAIVLQLKGLFHYLPVNRVTAKKLDPMPNPNPLFGPALFSSVF